MQLSIAQISKRHDIFELAPLLVRQKAKIQRLKKKTKISLIMLVVIRNSTHIIQYNI